MSLRGYTPNANTNSSSDIVEYEEPVQYEGIYTGMSWAYVPQAGKKRAIYANRFDENTGQPVKRDPITEQDWASVDPGSLARLKALVHDAIVVEEKLEDGTIASYAFLQLHIIPLTSYTDWGVREDGQGNAKHGGRQLWAYYDDPKHPKYKQQIMAGDAKIACASPDGITPYAQHVGTAPFRNTVNAPFHPKWERHIPIGEDGKGNVIPAEKICARCPFNNWADGKPPCGTSWKFVAWAPAQVDIYGEIMSARLIVIGGPYSIQAAFQGQKAGSKWGHATRNLPRWDDLTKATRKSKKYVAVQDVTEEMFPLIIGFASSDNKFAHLKGREYVSVPVGSVQTAEDFQSYEFNLTETASELEAVRFVEIQEEAFTWAPEGLNGPIYPLEMISVLNNNTGSEQRVPMITGPKDDSGNYIFEPLEPKEVRDFFSDWHVAMKRRAQWEQLTKDNIAAINKKREAPTVTEPDGTEELETVDGTVDDLDE
jgi:hypothetical protein